MGVLAPRLAIGNVNSAAAVTTSDDNVRSDSIDRFVSIASHDCAPISTPGLRTRINPQADDGTSALAYARAMTTLRTAIYIAWGVFWFYWLICAAGAKRGSRSTRARAPGLLVIPFIVLIRVLGVSGLLVHDRALEIMGTVLFAAGLALAVWARVHLGRNWGMPMSEKDEPELVTSGPYRFIRHPIYSGLLLAALGTGLATNLYWLIVLGVMGAYFIYSATVEERLLTSSFPTTYPSYQVKTKMLVPFVL